ncbi:hypothetical protein [Maridesulfovibrio sp.]|uniref:hypothetical protein n=1 Tax=Maridesulfovibrio sp. TaxID=2795000 RepID=UPI0029CA7E0B|nr:hypothetical protein [Maridesulfovibrio sp.]
MVEEALTNQISNIRQNNPVTSDQNFIHNLKIVYQNHKFERETASEKIEIKYKAKLPLFEWLMSCPIWMFYINSNSSFFAWHNYFVSEIISNEIDDIFEYLFPDYKYSTSNPATLLDYYNSLAIVGMSSIKLSTNEEFTREIMQKTLLSLKSQYALDKIESLDNNINYTNHKEAGLDSYQNFIRFEMLDKDLDNNEKAAIYIWFARNEIKYDWTSIYDNEKQAIKENALLSIVKSIANSANYNLKNHMFGDYQTTRIVTPNSISSYSCSNYFIPALIKFVIQPEIEG